MTGVAVRLLALLVAAAAGCQSGTAIPPPTELADRDESVHEQVSANARLLAKGDAAAQLSKLDATLNAISARYGARSVEMSQATTDTGLLLLSNGDRYDLAEPYFERALAMSREVFGTDHRETGFALHDLAIVRDEVRPEPFATRVEPLIREAIAVRRHVLGPEHKETAASERTLAAFQISSWRRQANPDPASKLLVEAKRNVSHALPAMERALGESQFEVTELRYMQVEIALAMKDYRLAGVLASELISRHQKPCSGIEGSPNAKQLEAAALRGQGRNAEAEAAENAGPDEACQIPKSRPTPIDDPESKAAS